MDLANLEIQLLRQIDVSALSDDEQAWLRCGLAKQLEEAGEYEAARDAMGDLWQHIGERPQVDNLDQHTAAEVLLRIGVLYGWLGSAKQVAGAQEAAKDLISESISFFERLQGRKKVAEALIDLAYCYWREGAFDEARVLLRDALSRLTDEDSNLKAIALLRSAIVEKVATRYGDALRILTEAAPLVEASNDHALKGKFHNEIAQVLRNLGATERREDYTDRALIEYAAASFHFEQAGHVRYRAYVENNLAFLFLTAGKFTEAHEHLDHARRLFVSLKDSGHAAQVDETRARAFLGEHRYAEAGRAARDAVQALEAGGQQSLLAEALRTYGLALARLNRYDEAQSTLTRAAEIAEQAGDYEGAGQAALTLIEEMGERFSPAELGGLYERACELLAASQHPELLARLSSCARRVLYVVMPALSTSADKSDEAFDVPSTWNDFSYHKEVRRYESHLIERALQDSNGVVTRAARLLGFNHHQSLVSLLNTRHKTLLDSRSPVRVRRRSIIIRDAHTTTHEKTKSPGFVTILHAEADETVADMAKELLEPHGWRIERYAGGDTALKRLGGKARYDLLLLANKLSGISGMELIRATRKLSHRRGIPIIMFSAGDCETEAWSAGADAFLRKPADMFAITSTIARLLNANDGDLK